MAGKKPMPIGIEDFKELCENYCFVDKTRFIQELLDSKGKVTLLTRPRRFGKTLTLSMLEYFFALEKGKENRRLFRGLDIEKAGEEYMAEQGTRPVIFMTLKDIQQMNWSDTLDKMAIAMFNLYGEFAFLAESPKLTEEDRAFFRSIRARKGTQPDLESAIASLCRMLETHYGKKPILLLDEYDAPIQAAWAHGFYDECIGFMRNFLSAALKTNPFLDFAVLTGITRISKESIFSGLNNLNVCTVLTERYRDAVGFTQEEVARLMEDCGAGERLPEVKEWYDGYVFGGLEIYNPWSVIKYVDAGCRFAPYWLNVSGNSILQVLLRHVDDSRQSELEGLMRGQPVEAVINEGIIYPDIQTDENALYMMLLTTGYLKAVKVWQDARKRWRCHLQIPNEEVRMAYEDEILRKIAVTGRQEFLYDMLDAMTAGDLKAFQSKLQKILLDCVSFHDAAQSESFHHGMMLGFSVLMQGAYRVESNGESGYGRFDLAFFPEKEKAPGVILEFKKAKSQEELEAAAKEALGQIAGREYETALQRQGVKEVWKYGISFAGKRVWMEMGMTS